MSHIIFGSYDTRDTGLIVAPYEIPMPKVQTQFVSIPGRDGTLDLSESTGTIRYGDRNISVTLYAVGDYQDVLSGFVNAVHGKRMDIVFDRYPDFHFTGRADVSGVAKKDGYCQISVKITAEPYKYSNAATERTVTSSSSVTLTNGRMPVIPTVICTVSCQLDFTAWDGSTAHAVLSSGTHLVPDLLLLEGDRKTVSVTLSGSGSVKFRYTEGEL